jgi:hydroxymethylpyrimidine pyrophosphatase-like HAD family hydrolase
MFYRIEENKLYDFADYKYANDCLETDITTQEELNKYPNKVIVQDGALVLNPEFEAEEEQKERERIGNLKLTKREVFLGLYQAKGVTPDMIKAQIQDPSALIEFEYANDYYRGNPLIDIVGSQLGITPEQLDKFFETNDYTKLIEE